MRPLIMKMELSGNEIHLNNNNIPFKDYKKNTEIRNSIEAHFLHHKTEK